MKIETIKTIDIPSLSHLQPEGWVDIIPVFEYYSKSPFCFPIKVTVEDKIIGLGCIVIHHDVAWLAHIIVDSAYRCNGIGQKITRALIENAEQNDCTTMYLIATELGEFVYRKVGFVTETEYLFHTNVVKRDWVISDSIRQYEEKYMEQVRVLDKAVSGEDRMMHLEEHLENCLVYYKNDTVEGYYMPTFGEGLIIAGTETAGIELLKLHLKDNDRVVIPQENHTARKFLEETGEGEIKAIKRMRLGKEREVQFSNIYNRIGGNVG
ncbi:MAG TPA: hypothetical protein DIT04_05760 [Dysgonomonas sp.]|nr:hypothetical protein [Dysgonomonas sp.]